MTFRTGCAAVLVALAAWSLEAGPWPTKGHDDRRTGQSSVAGPPSAALVQSVALDQEIAINMPVTIDGHGHVFVGTWGAVHDPGTADRTLWDKYDGKVYAFDLRMRPAWSQPFPGDPVPYCYSYDSRPGTLLFCPAGGTLNGYNGTDEGVIASSSDGSTLYVGRGDGKLYAIDPATGQEKWSFRTFNPMDPNDPEGGGEVIAGPLAANDGTVYFTTVGIGSWETSAVYAVTADGHLRWRYPSTAKSAPNTFWAAPALSPDGKTLYVGGGWGPTADHWDTSVPGRLYAFDVTSSDETGDQRLEWTHDPVDPGQSSTPTIWTTVLAVGSDGTIYGAGPEYAPSGNSAVLFAVHDEGDHATSAWSHVVGLDPGNATVSVGLALREVGGVTRRIYADSGNVFNTLFGQYKSGGKLYAIDPATGASLWASPFDPLQHGGFGAMTGIAIDRNGVVYTGVSGQRDGGRVYAISPDGSSLWSYAVGGLLEWSHPVLGPDGSLWFGETRRCSNAYFPIEDGACNGVDISPRLYVIHARAPRERGVRR